MDRKYITQEYYPGKIAVEDFARLIQNDLAVFIVNMKTLKMPDNFPEIWMQLFTKWLELDTNEHNS